LKLGTEESRVRNYLAATVVAALAVGLGSWTALAEGDPSAADQTWIATFEAEADEAMRGRGEEVLVEYKRLVAPYVDMQMEEDIRRIMEQRARALAIQNVRQGPRSADTSRPQRPIDGAATGAGAVTLVVRGEAAAVIVVPDNASRVTQYAAEELVAHIEKATGVKLPVASQSRIPSNVQSRIFIGPTAAAQARGINVSDLEPDAFLMRTYDRDLYIVARDREDEHPLSGNTRFSGSMFGVYELLERFVGVRWLWPGELGTYIPKTDTIVVTDRLNETIAPALRFRNIRSSWTRGHRSNERIMRMAFTDDGLRNYANDLSVYIRRHRLGMTERKPSTGHAFEGWWRQHGESNPDWFRMDGNGKRVGPTMCVSNPDLHNHILRTQWRGDTIRLGEADSINLCECSNCKAWDGPQPSRIPAWARHIYRPAASSDRYARFWLTIYNRGRQQNPNIKITTFLYQRYFPAPQSNIRLNPNIYGEFVQWGDPGFSFYPMPEDAHEWLKEQWMGWKRTGITMAYRPNYLYGGYAMPYFNISQMVDHFQYYYQNGMVGTDYDKLHGQWATQGPMLYVLMRLHVDPTLNADRVLNEYYEAFGPAANEVRRYFDYWQDHAMAHVRAGRLSQHDRLERTRIGATHELYRARDFTRAEQFLRDAAARVRSDAQGEYAQRVEFLRLGLEHAKLCARLSEAMADAPQQGSNDFRRAQQALRDLIAFRREHERTYIIDFGAMALYENNATRPGWSQWNINTLFPLDE